MVEYVKLEEVEKQKKVPRDVGFTRSNTIMGLHSQTLFAGYIMGFSGSLLFMYLLEVDIFPKWTVFLSFAVGIFLLHKSTMKAFKLVHMFHKMFSKMNKEIEEYKNGENKKKE